MKKNLLLAIIFLTGLFAHSQSPGSWTQKANFGGLSRSFAVSFSIGSKGYVGTGGADGTLRKDFWEYDPFTNAWTQKADYGGGAREKAIGFSVNGKGYIGNGINSVFAAAQDCWEYDPLQNTWTRKADFPLFSTEACGFSIGNKGYFFLGRLWEYDPGEDKWTEKADLSPMTMSNAVGFSIGNKGYIGSGSGQLDYTGKGFWEYDPAIDVWTRKADFGGDPRFFPVGFSIGNKGYIGTGFSRTSFDRTKDFWEYDPTTDAWTSKADFGGEPRDYAVGFSIGNSGYIGIGEITLARANDFWEYTPGSCILPSNLVIQKISDTCARLSWSTPDASAEHIKVSYRALGDTTWIEDRKNPTKDSKIICGLTSNTTYEWKVRNICADDKTDWVHGPNFTTTSFPAFTSVATDLSNSKIQGNINVQIMPNPNKGNFTIQMQLPNKATLTTLALYNSIGVKVWQQNAGNLSGSVSKIIALESKLSAGLYVLMLQQNDARLIQKIVVTK